MAQPGARRSGGRLRTELVHFLEDQTDSTHLSGELFKAASYRRGQDGFPRESSTTTSTTLTLLPVSPGEFSEISWANLLEGPDLAPLTQNSFQDHPFLFG